MSKEGIDDVLAQGGTVDDLRLCIINPEDLAPQKRKAVRAPDLVKMALNAGITLWKDEDLVPFATVPKGGHYENVRCESPVLKGALASILITSGDEMPGSTMLNDAVDLCKNHAMYAGETQQTAIRVWFQDETLYIFMADNEHRVIRVTGRGWEIIEGHLAPVRFIKVGGLKELPVPSRRGSLDALAEVINLTERELELVKAFLLGTLLPDGEYPVLVACGEEGSGKSTSLEVIRSVIDPRRVSVGVLPKEERDLASRCSSSHVIVIDNLSSLPDWMSDRLCQIATGVGFEYRKLYNDFDPAVAKAWSPIILGGIAGFVKRSDLLSRTMTVHFPRLQGTKKNRRKEKVRQRFRELWPEFLGGLLDLAVRALANRAEIPEDGQQWPRLADFCHWVTASEPLEQRGTFLRLIRDQESEARKSMVDDDPLSDAIRSYVNRFGARTMTADEWRKTLIESESYGKDNPAPEGFPRSAEALAKRLPRIAPSLRAVGIMVKQEPRVSQRRPWTIAPQDAPEEPSSLAEPSPEEQFEPELEDDGWDDGSDFECEQPSLENDAPSNLFHGVDDSADTHDGSSRQSLIFRLSEEKHGQ